MRYYIIALLLFPFAANAQKNTKATEQAVRNFAAAINKHDAQQIVALMAADPVFTDAGGGEVVGKEKMIALWGDYLKQFPDYNISITSCIANGDTTALFGYAEGHYKGRMVKENYLHQPACWKAVVQDHKIKLWQTYADTKQVSDVMSGNSVAAGAYDSIPKARGIGGIFFKCKNPDSVRTWYQQHLHMDVNQYGTNFEWRQGGDPSRKGFTSWSPFSERTKYFAPSTKEFMINYRVTNLEALIEQLKKEGVTVVDKIEAVDYGKFVHILDCEQNKIELWEPVDTVYDKMGAGGGVTK